MEILKVRIDKIQSSTFFKKHRLALSFFTLAILTVLCFFPTFFNDFQYGWDDTWQLIEYPYVTKHSLSDLIYHFTHFYYGQYFPVNTLFYIGVYEMFGFNPLAFHSACLLVHILNVVLVYTIIKEIISFSRPAYSPARINTLSFLTALFFAIHPLQVESVAWISASKILLYAFFTLLGLLFYTYYIKSKKIGWLILIALCYLLSFCSKEQGIIFPLILFTFDYIFNRFKDLKGPLAVIKKRVLLEKVPFFAIAFSLWFFSIINNLGGLSSDLAFPLYQRLLLGMHSFMEYIFRFLAPVKLYYFYYFPIKYGEELPLVYWLYPVLLLILLAFMYSNYCKGNRIVLFGFLFFVVNLLLVLHIIPMPREMVTADRYMYLSIVGLGLALCWLSLYLIKKRPTLAKYTPMLVALYFLCVGIQTFYRTTQWKDSKTMKNNVEEILKRNRQLSKTH